MTKRHLPLLLIAIALLPMGCHESWDIGHSQDLHRDGWNIHLTDISDDSITQDTWGTAITTGGHTIVIANGVTIDGNSVATGSSGNLKIVRGNGTVTVTINGKAIDVD